MARRKKQRRGKSGRFSGTSKFHKKSSSSAENAARLKLRSVIDELGRGQCPRAATELVLAAQLVGSMQAHKQSGRRKKDFKGKGARLMMHLNEVTRAFERSCVKGSVATFPQRSMPRSMSMPVAPSFRLPYSHPGPRGKLPGAPPPQGWSPMTPAPQSSDERWYGAHSRAEGSAPTSHTHPFVDGLGGVKVYRTKLNRGGYDRSGKYWGTGEKLWVGQDETGRTVSARAPTRKAALVRAEADYLQRFPSARTRRR